MKKFKRIILVSLLTLSLYPLATHGQTGEETMLMQAKQHLQNQKYSYATTWLERLLRTYPKSSHRKEVLTMLAQAYAASDREEKGAEAVRALVREFPEVATSLDPKLIELGKQQVTVTPPPTVVPRRKKNRRGAENCS